MELQAGCERERQRIAGNFRHRIGWQVFGTGSIKDAVDCLLQAGQFDNKRAPIGWSRAFQMIDELVGQSGERVTVRRMSFQIAGGELIEQLIADGKSRTGKLLAEDFQ